MNDKVVILTLSGNYISLEEWQQKYGLQVGSNKIGKYFDLNEREFAENIRNQGQLQVAEPLMMWMDGTRELYGSPAKVNSFNRSEQEQVALKKLEKRAATVSPHVAKMACDLDTKSKQDTVHMVECAREAMKKLNIKGRIGWKGYMEDGNTFIHMDVTPEYYSKFGVWHLHTHPAPWENVIEW